MRNSIAINAGSSSLKLQLFQMPEENVLAKGQIERIGLSNSVFTIETDAGKKKMTKDIPNHEEAVKELLEKLTASGVIQSLEEIHAVGHRVVHGGERFNEPVNINDEVIKSIDEISEFAPLHNPAHLTGIRALQEAFPNIPMVAVVQTSFHQTIPESAYVYSLPYEYYEQYGIRKYGFHGTAHQYVSERAAELLGVSLEQLRIISCHLGNGVSVAAIQNGQSMDRSMGFTLMAAVTLVTTAVKLNSGLIPYVKEITGQIGGGVIDVLNKKSGMLALSGFSSDLRDI